MLVGKDPLDMSKGGRWNDGDDRSAGRQEMEEAGVR